MFRNIKNISFRYKEQIVFLYLWILSLNIGTYYIINNYNLLYGDALSRLNISRKVIDNLTPGFAQLGNVWLPLPQVLMLPFIWNNYLWHSGIAGAIVSMLAFVIGGLFLFKTTFIITNSVYSSFFGVLVYSLNINLLYLQSTAMSEAIFLGSILAFCYYFTLWIKTNNKMNLIPAAIAVTAMTLTRYEGLAILAGSIPIVFLYTLKNTKSFSKSEGQTVVYTVLASFGFGLWTLYLTTIFGDPLYWQHYYIAPHIKGDSKTHLDVIVNQLSYPNAILGYTTAVIWMNGLIPTILSGLAIPVVIYKSIREKSYYFVILILLSFFFIFMVLTMHRNTPIIQPKLTINNLLDPRTTFFQEFNIRYGLLMLPLISLLCAYLYNVRFKVVKLVLIFLLSFQTYLYFNPIYSFMYQIPQSVAGNITQGTAKEKSMVTWLQKNYDYGLIMISALKHDPQMLELGFNYRKYIHEGTGYFWKVSITYPKKYARWVVYDSYNPDDQVTKYLIKSDIIKYDYNLVYNSDGMRIFKIKTHTDVNIN